jgi:hypothetical protein
MDGFGSGLGDRHIPVEEAMDLPVDAKESATVTRDRGADLRDLDRISDPRALASQIHDVLWPNPVPRTHPVSLPASALRAGTGKRDEPKLAPLGRSRL